MSDRDIESELREPLPAERRFGGKSRTIRAVEVADRASTGGADLLPVAGVKEILDHGK